MHSYIRAKCTNKCGNRLETIKQKKGLPILAPKHYQYTTIIVAFGISYLNTFSLHKNSKLCLKEYLVYFTLFIFFCVILDKKYFGYTLSQIKCIKKRTLERWNYQEGRKNHEK